MRVRMCNKVETVQQREREVAGEEGGMGVGGERRWDRGRGCGMGRGSGGERERRGRE